MAFRKFGAQMVGLGQKISRGYHNFGNKITSVSNSINSGVQKFDNFANKANNVLEKASGEIPLAKVAQSALGVAQRGAHLVADGSRIGSSLATGNLQGALNQGKTFMKDAGSFAGSAMALGGSGALIL